MIILKLPNIWSDRGSVWVCLESVTDVRKKLYGAAALIFWRISPWLRFFTSLKYSMASVRFWAPCIFLQYSLLLRLLKNYMNIQYYYFLLLLLLSNECIFYLIKYIHTLTIRLICKDGIPLNDSLYCETGPLLHVSHLEVFQKTKGFLSVNFIFQSDCSMLQFKKSLCKL